VFFTAALLVGGAAIVFGRARGDREGGAPLVVLALVLAGVVTLDAVGRGVVAVVRRLTLWQATHKKSMGPMGPASVMLELTGHNTFGVKSSD
jgi:hypothetical protein